MFLGDIIAIHDKGIAGRNILNFNSTQNKHQNLFHFPNP